MLRIFTPYFFNKFSEKIIPYLLVLLVLCSITSLYYALFASPLDYQQGEMVRMMYVHVPSAWMSIVIYSFIALCSFVNLVWRIKLLYFLSISAAQTGSIFAFLTLVTGSIWGKPIWGTWWVWDARLTSMLILFLLYLTYFAVVNSGDDINRAEKPASVIALIGFINIPIVKFSVDIWHSLHQPASILRLGAPTIHHSMLLPLFLMFFSFILYFLVSVVIRTKVILYRYRKYA